MGIPTGKGVWIWQAWGLLGGTIDAPKYDEVVQVLVAAGVSHVYLKIADGVHPYNVKWANFPRWSGDIKADVAGELAARLQQALIQVIGWQYVYGIGPLDEAAIAVSRTKALKLDGFSIDAEAEYKLAGKGAAAETYSEALRKGLPELLLSLATYRYPRLHPQLPYEPFLRRCDHNAPQVYWEQAHNPVQQLRDSRAQYEKLYQGAGMAAMPFTPVGSAYGAGSWRATPADVTAFLAEAKTSGCPSASLWSMDWMLALGPELWQAFAAFDWPADDVVPAPPPGNGASRQERMVADLRNSAGLLRRTAEDLEETARELEGV
jgi:hypothetical protein